MLFITESTQVLMYMILNRHKIPQEQSIIKKIHATQYKTQRITGLHL
jgi:hypothetical protein